MEMCHLGMLLLATCLRVEQGIHIYRVSKSKLVVIHMENTVINNSTRKNFHAFITVNLLLPTPVFIISLK